MWVTSNSPTDGQYVRSITPTSNVFDQATNRMNGIPTTDCANPGTYDCAGNLVSSNSVTYTFDAENRLVKSSTMVNGSAVLNQYVYDGDGRRIQKTVGTTNTWYVYDTGGQLAAEYSDGPVTVNGTQYLMADHLGSTRLVTGADGNCASQHDYLPFGEEIDPSQITRPPCYSNGPTDGVTEKFSGKERDPETGLDYFGARYLSSAQGRFMSADPKMFPHDMTDPQSWNKYGYTRNNPLRYVDPDGEDFWDYAAGVINAVGSNSTLGRGRASGGNNDFRWGQTVGDAFSAAQGVAEAVVGVGGEAAGLVLDATGIGALVGVPVGVAAAGVAAHGVVTAAIGTANFMSDVQANRTKGLASQGEALQEEGLAENKQKYPAADPKTGKAGSTVPDSVRPNGQTVEVKDVQRLSDSSQLRRQSVVSAKSGLKAQVIVKNPKATVSSTVTERMDVKQPNQ